ncbi:MAG: hypothetical protein M3041_00700 [Acidobacteriota bacterium]|nr:hypothetical protein [Acidobacteriota bacterium]
MPNRGWSLVAALLVIAVPAWPAVDPKLTPVLRVPLLSVKSVTLNPTSVTGGATVNGVVTVTTAVPGPVSVKIASSSSFAEVPQSVVIQQGATTASFIVQTHPVWINPSVVTSPPSAQISAQLGSDAPVVVTLTVLPPSLTSLTLNPASVAGGTNSTGTVTLSGPAPSAGIPVSLNTPSGGSSNPLSIASRFSGIGLPAQVTIPAGATSATFTVTTHPVAASTTYQINAPWGAFVTKTATLTVTPPDVAAFSPAYASSAGGKTYSATLNLSGPAPADGMTVSLRTAMASGGTTGTFAQCGPLPSVPATVTVPAGATSVGVPVTTAPGFGMYWVIASTATKTAMQSLAVWHRFTPVVPASIKGGTQAQGKIELSGPLPANCGGHYTLTSSNTNYAQVPPSVDIPAEATEVAFTITTSALPASSQPVPITISIKGVFVGENSPAPPAQYTQTSNVTITP